MEGCSFFEGWSALNLIRLCRMAERGTQFRESSFLTMVVENGSLPAAASVSITSLLTGPAVFSSVR